MIHTSSVSPGRKVNCTEVLKRYPVERYGDQKSKSTGVYKGKQSHHVIQNSHFQSPRGTTVPGICKNYTEDDAPCIPLLDGTNTKTEHGRVSKMQKADGKRYRARNSNPTYAEARQDAKNQLTAKPKPGLSEPEAECILKKVDASFRKMCGRQIAKQQIRAPGSRKAWKPTRTRPTRRSA